MTGDRAHELGRYSPGDLVDGRYRVVASLAAGGMGEVFKVEHVSLGKPFALKVMLAGVRADEASVERFRREAMAASQIGHPNIIDVTDLGQTPEGVVYFVMEFLGGTTLSSLLAEHGALTPARTVGIGLQIAEAVAAAHERGIVHRDLKPDNVMLVRRGSSSDFVKVLDFGVARIVQKGSSVGGTSAGQLIGTPAYMSPEQAKGLAADARSDVYSLGIVLHELLTGKPVFSAESMHMLMLQHVEAVPPPLPRDVPPKLRALIEAMLRKAPEERPESMRAVHDALLAVRTQSRDEDGSGRPALVLVGVAAVVCAVIAGAVFSLQDEPPPTPRPALPAAVVARPPPPAPVAPAPAPVTPPPPRLSHADVVALLERATAAKNAKQFADANALADQCIEADPTMLDCYVVSGTSAAAIRDVATARARYAKFLELAPPTHRLRKNVADLLSNYYRDEAQR